ncbi:hypothetical protein HD553DRAFT_325493 [Filobasidium floriforme]|uniref:uncharacterized protein n=1 Tax=Filobasidium floriforme TaxID=5210 RepID=UPI001E8D79F8|nr:uncharacterized protein HD553DRAFT_325493 [Filobasidium floriforme]KAH8081474.1 hypothetical protein HD553DRAFT_325493 [Filobasidium floriforme]
MSTPNEIDPLEPSFWNEGRKMLGAKGSHLYGTKGPHKECFARITAILTQIVKLPNESLLQVLRSCINPMQNSHPLDVALGDLPEVWKAVMPPKDSKPTNPKFWQRVRSHICYELWGNMILRGLSEQVRETNHPFTAALQGIWRDNLNQWVEIVKNTRSKRESKLCQLNNARGEDEAELWETSIPALIAPTGGLDALGTSKIQSLLQLREKLGSGQRVYEHLKQALDDSPQQIKRNVAGESSDDTTEPDRKKKTKRGHLTVLELSKLIEPEQLPSSTTLPPSPDQAISPPFEPLSQSPPRSLTIIPHDLVIPEPHDSHPAQLLQILAAGRAVREQGNHADLDHIKGIGLERIEFAPRSFRSGIRLSDRSTRSPEALWSADLFRLHLLHWQTVRRPKSLPFNDAWILRLPMSRVKDWGPEDAHRSLVCEIDRRIQHVRPDDQPSPGPWSKALDAVEAELSHGTRSKHIGGVLDILRTELPSEVPVKLPDAGVWYAYRGCHNRIPPQAEIPDRPAPLVFHGYPNFGPDGARLVVVLFFVLARTSGWAHVRLIVREV